MLCLIRDIAPSAFRLSRARDISSLFRLILSLSFSSTIYLTRMTAGINNEMDRRDERSICLAFKSDDASGCDASMRNDGVGERSSV